MGLDDTISLDRIATAFEKIAAALEHRNRIELDRLAKLFPPEKEKRAEVINTDRDKREQYSDKGSPDWFDETEAATPQSRFQERFHTDSSANKTKPVEKRRRVVEVPGKQ